MHQNTKKHFEIIGTYFSFKVEKTPQNVYVWQKLPSREFSWFFFIRSSLDIFLSGG